MPFRRSHIVPAAMPASTRRLSLALFAMLAATIACNDPAKEPAAEINVAPPSSLPPFRQEIASQKAEVTLPGVWKYGYRLVDQADTTLGAKRAIEFWYGGDSASRTEPRLLLRIRVFSKERWAAVSAGQKKLSSKLAEHGDHVYAYSIVTNNPYPMNTAAGLRVEAMMVALTAKDSPFRIDFK